MNYDEGLREDFDNMTEELSGGRKVMVYPRKNTLNYEGQEGTDSGRGEGSEEVVFLQELDTTHETPDSGIMYVGDVRFTFKSDSIAEEEGTVVDGDVEYKILELTKTKNMSDRNLIIDIRAFGKKLPKR